MFGVLGVLPLFQPCTRCRAYADLPTVLTIVHCDGTPILSLRNIFASSLLKDTLGDVKLRSFIIDSEIRIKSRRNPTSMKINLRFPQEGPTESILHVIGCSHNWEVSRAICYYGIVDCQVKDCIRGRYIECRPSCRGISNCWTDIPS